MSSPGGALCLPSFESCAAAKTRKPPWLLLLLLLLQGVTDLSLFAVFRALRGRENEGEGGAVEAMGVKANMVWWGGIVYMSKAEKDSLPLVFVAENSEKERGICLFLKKNLTYNNTPCFVLIFFHFLSAMK